MIFKLHYWFLASGANAIGILLGVFIGEYTDASSTEIGMLYMMMPFIGIFFRPTICSLADRRQAHRKYLMICLFVVTVSYFPFVVIPMLGPQLYDAHPRLCFYILLFLKVLGDAAFGGVVSIGDSLAINYAKRINVDFSVYRVWGTISWMFFGLLIGQVNEIWFLPKYVPAFIVLITSSLLNMFVIYLWPKEYFVMVTHQESIVQTNGEKGESGINSDDRRQDKSKTKRKKESAMTKSLLPREVVWANAKKQFWLLVTFRCMQKQENNLESGDAVCVKSSNDKGEQSGPDAGAINKKTQLRILLLLIRRDPRIVLYLILFIFAGFSVVPMSFLFMSLAQICHHGNRCEFSQLGGLLQVSMAFAETILFIYIKRIIKTIGRLNTMAVAFFLTFIRFGIYGTIWPSLNPYFSIMIELNQGIIFGIFLTLMVELGYLFASEVEYVVQELMEKQIIPKNANKAALKLSLQATMQAIISNANDGLGRGFGALIYGLIVDHYSYQTLWRTIAIGSAIVFIVTMAVNIADHIFKFQLGLDAVAAKRQGDAKIVLQESGCTPAPPKTERAKDSNSDLKTQDARILTSDA